MRGLLIFGATSLAKLAHYYATTDLALPVRGFVVDEQYKNGDEFMSLPLISWQRMVDEYATTDVDLFVAVGYKNMRQRANAYGRAKQAGYKLINIVAKSAYIANDVTMGENNIVMPGVVIEPGVTMAENNVVWSNASICHDCNIGSHNFIAANTTLGGYVSLGDQNFLGFSTVVIQERRIGNETLIGAQSLVNRDTDDLSRYCGVPARKITSIDPRVGITLD